MSNVSYSVVTPAPVENPETFSAAFVKNFRDGEGAIFGIFSVPASAGYLAGLVRDRIERWAEKTTPTPNLLEAGFEHLVQSINEECRDAIEQESSPIEIQALDIAIGATCGTVLVMTSTGEFRCTFIREEKEQTFHVYDLLRGLREEVRGADKLFGSLVSGEVNIGDTLALALPETITEIGYKQWKELLATLTPGEVRAQLLKSLDMRPALGATTILRITKKEVAAPVRPKDASIASIEALRRTERATSTLLSGRGLPTKTSFQGIVKNVIGVLIGIANWITDQLRHISWKKLFQGMIRAPRRVAIALPQLVRAPRELFKTQTQSGHRKSWREIPQATARLRDFGINRFNTLPRTSKLLLLLIVVFVVLFLQSILYLNYRGRVVVEREAYAVTLASISQLQDEADANIIYQDEEKARGLLLDARERTKALSINSRSRRRTQSEVLTEIETSLAALRHEIKIEPGALTPGDEKSWLALYAQSTPENPIRSITNAEGRTVVLYHDGAMSMQAADGSLAPLAVNLPKEPVDDAELFGGDRLYVWVSAAPQIYRLRRQGASFGSASPWLQNGADAPTDTRSISIDGAIYMLRANEVVKFFTGAREDWKPYIDPPLEDATKIWTSDEATGIYILEPSKRRVVVLGKPGTLLAQYLFPEGSDLKDFAVNEAKKILTILDGSSLKQISLSHFDQRAP